MPTPLAEFKNARVMVAPKENHFNHTPGLVIPGAVGPGYMIELYSKQGDRDVTEDPLRGSTSNTVVLNGYCVRWTEIPGTVQFNDPLDGNVWDDSGHFPAGLRVGDDHKGAILNFADDPYTVDQWGIFHFIRIRSPFGPGGIGEIIGGAIGDSYQIWFSRTA